MSTDTNALGNEVQKVVPAEWKSIRTWAEKLLTKERMMETGLVMSTIVMWGLLITLLNQALQNYSIIGF